MTHLRVEFPPYLSDGFRCRVETRPGIHRAAGVDVGQEAKDLPLNSSSRVYRRAARAGQAAG